MEAFLAQTDAVIAHDASGVLGEIDVPTLITFEARDLVCSARFADPLNSGIAGSEPVVFDHLTHAGLHEDSESFNRATLDFLLRQRSSLHDRSEMPGVEAGAPLPIPCAYRRVAVPRGVRR